MKVIIVTLILSLPHLSFCDSFVDQLSLVSKNDKEIPSPYLENDNLSTEELKPFFEYIDSIMKTNLENGEKFYPNKSLHSFYPLYNINLRDIKNKYLKSQLTFRTSKGTIVYVSASKSVNCPDLSNECSEKEKFFIILTTQGNDTFFIRAMEIVNWGFMMKGSKTVVIDGEEYRVKIYANASNPAKSKLEIKGPSGAVLSSDLDKLVNTLTAEAIGIKLSKTYKLAYGSEIVQTGKGNAKFTQNNLILLIPFPVEDASSYFLLKESDIKSFGTVFPSMEPNYVFKIIDHKLEIYVK